LPPRRRSFRVCTVCSTADGGGGRLRAGESSLNARQAPCWGRPFGVRRNPRKLVAPSVADDLHSPATIRACPGGAMTRWLESAARSTKRSSRWRRLGTRVAETESIAAARGRDVRRVAVSTTLVSNLRRLLDRRRWRGGVC